MNTAVLILLLLSVYKAILALYTERNQEYLNGSTGIHRKLRVAMSTVLQYPEVQ